MRIFDAAETADLLSMERCIDAMQRAMLAVSAGTLRMPPRQFLETGVGNAALGVMPCISTEEKAAITKVLSLTPENAERGLPTIQGFVALMELETGSVSALIDGAALTEIRTAAASGLATRLLARPDARSCGIFGAGVQAAAHLRAMCTVRPIGEARVWARAPLKAQEFAERETLAQGIPVSAYGDPQDVAACDILCTVTGAAEPVLRGDWVHSGAHVNLVGAHAADRREADSALIARAAVFVDSLRALENEGGDIAIPLAEGVIDGSHIRGELGQLLSGAIAGRTDDAQITLYNSVGMAAQDLFAALELLRAVAEQ